VGQPDEARRVRFARTAVGYPTQVFGDHQPAADHRELCLAWISAGEERERKARGDGFEEQRIGEQDLLLPQTMRKRVGDGLARVETEQLLAFRAAVESPANTRDLGRVEQEVRILCVQSIDAAAACLGKKNGQGGRLFSSSEKEEQRDGAGHLPIVVEAAGGLELGNFRCAIEPRFASGLFANDGCDRPPRGLFCRCVVAGPCIEEDAVDVEDDAANGAQREVHLELRPHRRQEGVVLAGRADADPQRVAQVLAARDVANEHAALEESRVQLARQPALLLEEKKVRA